MQALHDKYNNKGVVVLGVSIDKGNIEKVKKYVEELELTFLNLHDPMTKSAAGYGVRGVPTTYLIDTTGTIIGSVIGPRPWDGEDVQKLVEQLLAEAHK